MAGKPPRELYIFCVLTTAESLGGGLVPIGVCLPPPPPPGRWLGLLSVLGRRFCSVVVDLFLIVAPVVGFCVCSMFSCALLCVLSRFVIILLRKR